MGSGMSLARHTSKGLNLLTIHLVGDKKHEVMNRGHWISNGSNPVLWYVLAATLCPIGVGRAIQVGYGQGFPGLVCLNKTARSCPGIFLRGGRVNSGPGL